MNEKMRAYNARREIDVKKKKDKRSQTSLRKFREKAKQEDKCRNPECMRSRRFSKLHAHHIVHRGKFNPYNKERDNPNNAMALCFVCHTNYHTGKLFPNRSWLRDEEIAFIIEHVGSGWLGKVYPKSDK